MLDEPRKRRYGPKPMDPKNKRVHSVSVRLNAAELAELDIKRGRLQRGSWLRQAAMGRIPPTIPSINRDAWSSLATVISNLNQYQFAINAGTARTIPSEILDSLREQVQALRQELIGVRHDTEDTDDERDA